MNKKQLREAITKILAGPPITSFYVASLANTLDCVDGFVWPSAVCSHILDIES